MLLGDMFLETLWDLIFLSTFCPGTPDKNVQVAPGVVVHGIFVLQLFGADGAVVECLRHHFATGLAHLFRITHSGAELLFNAELGGDVEGFGVQDGFFAGV